MVLGGERDSVQRPFLRYAAEAGGASSPGSSFRNFTQVTMRPVLLPTGAEAGAHSSAMWSMLPRPGRMHPWCVIERPGYPERMDRRERSASVRDKTSTVGFRITAAHDRVVASG